MAAARDSITCVWYAGIVSVNQGKIGIVGGGLTGIVLAHRLSQLGYSVTLFEGGQQIGGLATWHDFGAFKWDRFYHVVLPTDKFLIAMIKELGLENQLEWKKTFTGYFVNGKLYSISSNLDFLKFPLLSPLSKVRLAWTLWYGSRISNWRRLERFTVEQWLQRTSGRRTYEMFWKPLLLAKLGSVHTQASAVFIWAYIKRLYSARDSSAHAGQLGHVRGGYFTVFSRLQQCIRDSGGVIKCNTPVEHVRPCKNGKLELIANGEKYVFDKIICTSPTTVLQKMVDPALLQLKQSAANVDYLGVVCVILLTSKPLVPYYVVNIADPEIPFTGVIGMSTVIDIEQTGNHYLTYLPRYMLSTDEEFKRDDEYFRESFIGGVKRMLPEFDPGTIISTHVHRAAKVQPLQVVNYSQIIPGINTLHPAFFVLNTSQFVNATLNNNEVVRSVEEFCRDHAASLNSNT